MFAQNNKVTENVLQAVRTYRKNKFCFGFASGIAFGEVKV